MPYDLSLDTLPVRTLRQDRMRGVSISIKPEENGNHTTHCFPWAAITKYRRTGKGRDSMFEPTDEQLPIGIKNVNYAVGQMVWTASQLLGTNDAPRSGRLTVYLGPPGRAFLESCLTHVRNLDDFLGRKRPFGNGTDPTPLALHFGYEPKLVLSRDEKQKICAFLSHMTYDRPVPQWDIRNIVDRILTGLRDFVDSPGVQCSDQAVSEEFQTLRNRIKAGIPLSRSRARREFTSLSDPTTESISFESHGVFSSHSEE